MQKILITLNAAMLADSPTNTFQIGRLITPNYTVTPTPEMKGLFDWVAKEHLKEGDQYWATIQDDGTLLLDITNGLNRMGPINAPKKVTKQHRNTWCRSIQDLMASIDTEKLIFIMTPAE
jgi:hypothetical protein